MTGRQRTNKPSINYLFPYMSTSKFTSILQICMKLSGSKSLYMIILYIHIYIYIVVKLHFCMFWWISNTPLKTNMEPKKWRFGCLIQMIFLFFWGWLSGEACMISVSKGAPRWIVLMLIRYKATGHSWAKFRLASRTGAIGKKESLTSHDRFPPNGSVLEGKWDPLLQGNLGWWNIIIWPDYMYRPEN